MTTLLVTNETIKEEKRPIFLEHQSPINQIHAAHICVISEKQKNSTLPLPLSYFKQKIYGLKSVLGWNIMNEKFYIKAQHIREQE